MVKFQDINYQSIIERLRVKKPWDSVIIFLLNILIAIPIFIVIHKNVIDPEWPFQVDRFVLILLIITIIQLILQLLRRVLIIALFLYIMALGYGSATDKYGFNSIYEDYRFMIYAMVDNPNPQDIIISKLLPFPNKSKIIKAVEYDNPQVRNLAIMATSKYFKDVKGYNKYRTLIQCFAVFKEINGRWNYVNDPKGREYIAKATESVKYFSGDCDDHSILMVAAVKSIGGIPRLIHTGGHIYPEILIGDKSDLETINFLIKKVLFVEESKDQTLHYHIDERGQVWLNLDYTAKYPGGPFLREEILGALTL